MLSRFYRGGVEAELSSHAGTVFMSVTEERVAECISEGETRDFLLRESRVATTCLKTPI